MIDEFDLVIIGAGASSFGFIKGLRKSGIKIAIIAPFDDEIEYKNELIWPKNASPKLKNKSLQKSANAWFKNFPKKLKMARNFTYFGLSKHGGTEFWGNSVGMYEQKDFERLGLNQMEIHESCRQLIKKGFPVSGNYKDDIHQYYQALPQSSLPFRSSKISSFDGIYCEGRMHVGAARTSVNQNRLKNYCIGCGDCINGCPEKALWSSGKNIDHFEHENVTKLNVWAKSIIRREGRYVLSFKPSKNVTPKKIKTKKIVLAVDPLTCFSLLTSFCTMPISSTLFSSPSIAWAGVTLKRTPKDTPLFGLAQSQIFIKGNQGDLKSAGHVFDGNSLYKYKNNVFTDINILESALRLFLPNIVLGNLFFKSRVFGNKISYDGTTIHLHDGKDEPIDNIKNSIKMIKSFCKQKKILFLGYKKANAGSDLHYAGGVPDELKSSETHHTKLKDIFVIGGAAFGHLPPQSPAFMFMAAAYNFAAKNHWDFK